MKFRRFLCSLCTAALLISVLPTTLGAENSDTGYSDADQITHLEAVTALTRLDVVQGKDDRAFHPADTLTRAEAAKLITLIMNGGQDYFPEEAVTSDFSDTQGHWAEHYIKYCADLGIIVGRGDGTFGPNDEVIGFELLKMALGALGYDSSAYRLTGKTWAVRTDELARQSNPSLYAGLEAVNVAEPCTRDNAAQILYNTLFNTPKVVKPVPTPEGEVTWQFADATKKDGTPSSLLYERFGLEEIPDHPTQPEK